MKVGVVGNPRYADLRALLVARPDSAPTWSWWPADQSVGFWVRRMAHETAVHRWDAEGAKPA